MKPEDLEPALRYSNRQYIYMEHMADTQYFNRKQMADAIEQAIEDTIDYAWCEGLLTSSHPYFSWLAKVKELRGGK